MEKKKSKKRLIIGILIIVFGIAQFVYVCFIHKFTYTIHVCDYLFGCTPTEFVLGKADLPDELQFLEDSAGVDQYGKLKLSLTYYEKVKFRKSDWLNPNSSIKKYPYLTISEDYSVLTCYTAPDVTLSSKEKEELQDKIVELVCKIQVFHGLNNTPMEKRTIKAMIVDSDTGKIISERVLYEPK